MENQDVVEMARRKLRRRASSFPPGVSDSRGDGPSDCHGPRRPAGQRAASDAVLRRRRGGGSHGSPGSPCGPTKVDLTVSGLKSDSPPRIGIAGSAPAGVRAQQRAVCRNRRPTAAAGETRPSAGLQKDFGSDERESACKPGVFPGTADDRPAASPESVRPDADAQADGARKKRPANEAVAQSL